MFEMWYVWTAILLCPKKTQITCLISSEINEKTQKISKHSTQSGFLKMVCGICMILDELVIFDVTIRSMNTISLYVKSHKIV